MHEQSSMRHPIFTFFCLQQPKRPADLPGIPENWNDRKARMTGKVGKAGKAGKAKTVRKTNATAE